MLAIAHPRHRKVLACLVTLETIFRFHHSFVNAAGVRWADSTLVPVLSFYFFFKSTFVSLPIYHSKEKNRM